MEGSTYTRFVQLMKRHGYNKDVDLLMATVTSPPPHLRIRLDHTNTELYPEDVFVAEHLTRHSRIVTIEHVENEERQLGDKTEKDYLDTDDKQAPYSSFSYNFVKLTFEDVLKVGDRVAVAEFDNGQAFMIVDRMMKYK
ncbi:DUF2577 domain-containing protein [Aneurinibacillus sp. REN35]|uniref:DUF2577 domain-containing protein n=1 Tax=Aneurinibacillus sp. REN35 TaxID=3237286 RepID=UPI003529813A